MRTFPHEGYEIPPISMTRFCDFCVARPGTQLAKIREISRQYDQPYAPSEDFWSRWRAGVASVHHAHGGRGDLDAVAHGAKSNRGALYQSASAGYAKFWGRRAVELVGEPKVAIWQYDRLKVRVNPEWLLRIDGELVVVKLHLKEKLTLDQRLSNPLLHLLETHFAVHETGVGLLDVHRGRLFRPNRTSRAMEPVLQMQAAAFVVGWDAVRDRAA